MGSHDCWGKSVVNDVKSNGRMLFGELELRKAMLKFRGPGTGDSEGGEERLGKDEVRRGSMMSVSYEKDVAGAGGAFSRPSWKARC